ncbi:MAG: hypothetical protein LBH16_02790 [Treponema sp.]|jgi:hypothetical protein|nr:hypothetical protein [Treponema sp.]
MKKYAWIITLLAALSLAIFGIGCDNGSSDPTPTPTPTPPSGDLEITDAAEIGALLSATGWNSNPGEGVSTDENVAIFNIPAGGSTDNQGFKLDFPAGATGYLSLEVTFKVVEVTSLVEGRNAKIGFKSSISPTEDVTPYPEHELVFGTMETALGVELTQTFSLFQPNKLPNNAVWFSQNQYGSGAAAGSTTNGAAVSYKLEITKVKFVGGEAEVCCEDCDEECEACAEGLCTGNCYAEGDEDGDLTGKCCVPAEFIIDWTVFNAQTGLDKTVLGFEGNWGGTEGNTTFNDEGKFITINRTFTAEGASGNSALFSIALPAGTAADDVVVIKYIVVAEKGEPKLILKKNASGTDLMANESSWITPTIYPTLQEETIAFLALDMSKVADFAGLTKLSFQDNGGNNVKYNIKIIGVTKEKLAGFNLVMAVDTTTTLNSTFSNGQPVTTLEGGALKFAFNQSSGNTQMGIIALTPAQDALLNAVFKTGGYLKVTVTGTSSAAATFRSCFGNPTAGANWNGTSWIGAEGAWTGIAGAIRDVTFNASQMNSIMNADNPGSRASHLIIQQRNTTASDVTVSSVLVTIAPPNTPLEPIAATLNTVTANGSSAATTTALTLTFDKAITGFDASKITLGGSTGATKGTLTAGDTAGVYTLAVDGITESGDVTVTIGTIEGYAITGSPKTVAVFKSEAAPTAVTFNSVTANGTANEVTTTALTLTFSEAITGLAATDITLGGSTGATKGTLTPGTDGVYTLVVSGITVSGDVTVTIGTIPGYNITGSPKTVAVHKEAAVVGDITIDFTSINFNTALGGPSITKEIDGSGYTYLYQNGAGDNWSLAIFKVDLGSATLADYDKVTFTFEGIASDYEYKRMVLLVGEANTSFPGSGSVTVVDYRVTTQEASGYANQTENNTTPKVITMPIDFAAANTITGEINVAIYGAMSHGVREGSGVQAGTDNTTSYKITDVTFVAK